MTEKDYIYDIYNRYLTVYNINPPKKKSRSSRSPSPSHSIKEIDKYIAKYESTDNLNDKINDKLDNKLNDKINDKLNDQINNKLNDNNNNNDNNNDNNDDDNNKIDEDAIINLNDPIIDESNNDIDINDDKITTVLESTNLSLSQDNNITTNHETKNKSIFNMFKYFFKKKDKIDKITKTTKTTKITKTTNLNTTDTPIMFDNKIYNDSSEIQNKKFDLVQPTRSSSLNNGTPKSFELVTPRRSNSVNDVDNNEPIYSNKFNSNKSNSAKSNSAKSNSAKSNSAKSNSAKSNSAKSNSAKSNSAKSNSNKSINNDNLYNENNFTKEFKSNDSGQLHNPESFKSSLKLSKSKSSDDIAKSNRSDESNKSNRSNISNRSNRSETGNTENNNKESRSLLKTDHQYIKLDEILVDGDQLIMFLIFCMKHATHENICFLLEVMIFEKMIYPGVVLVDEIKRIQKRYLDTNSIMEINISADNKYDFIEKLASPNCSKCDNNIFNGMKIEIYALLGLDTMPKYINELNNF
jgi:hypothetical protein